MKRFIDLSFVSRIGIAMILSMAINLTWGYFLKKQLSQNDYVLEVAVDYDIASTVEMHYDTGKDFNRVQEVVEEVRAGENRIQFSFNVEAGEQLKFLRLDFGHESGLSDVQLNRLSLSSDDDILFDLHENEIARHSRLLNGIEQPDIESADYKIDVAAVPYDPYIVFDPVNELTNPLWQRTLFLLAPWILVLIFPISSWAKERFNKKEFALLLAALFLASIPLKIAWVTFTALLLLAYALFQLIQNRKIHFTAGRLAILGLFLVPLLFLGYFWCPCYFWVKGSSQHWQFLWGL